MNIEYHEALLGSGTRVPLIAAAAVLYLLEQLVNGPAEDRAALFHLRTACLSDSPVSEAARHPLAEMRFVDANGRVESVVREVVRAAVHGEGSGLFLVSPYTSPWDRALSDLVISREKVRGVLPTEQAEALIGGTLGQSEPKLRPTSWMDFVQRRAHPDGGLPPPSPN